MAMSLWPHFFGLPCTEEGEREGIRQHADSALMPVGIFRYMRECRQFKQAKK